MDSKVNRETGLDFIRATACFFVILLHVACAIFYKFSDQWIVCEAYDAPTRLCVPLFFMLTGYFLLNKQIDSVFIFYIQRLHRIIFPFLILCLIYYVKLCYFQHKLTSHEFITSLLKGKISGAFHLWYIFTLVGIYFSLPFFNYLFSTKNGIKLVILYLIIWFISTIVYPFFIKLEYININIFNTFNFSFFRGYMGYVLIGGIIARINFSKLYKIIGLSLYILSSLLIFISTVIYSKKIGKPVTIFVQYLTPFVLLQAVSFFIAFKDLKFNNRFILKFAELSYWIYLIHLLLRSEVYKIIPVNKYSIITIPVITIIVTLLGFIIAFPLSKFEFIFNKFIFNPLVNKIRYKINKF